MNHDVQKIKIISVHSTCSAIVAMRIFTSLEFSLQYMLILGSYIESYNRLLGFSE